MKRFLLLSILLLIPLFFMGCASNRNPIVRGDHTQETWMREVETNSNKWAARADRWFLTGDPNPTEQANNDAPYVNGMSTSQVSVPNFTNIKVDGAFQVQIFGTEEPNSVFVYGPNDAVRQVAVEYRHNVLYVRQVNKISPERMKSVIVRIGVRNLTSLTQMGCGSIEAIQIRSYSLCIDAAPGSTGDIYLAGNVNLTHVSQKGRGSINVFGAQTPVLDIEASGWGAINICGNVGVRSITHRGWGDVNIIGANTDSLTIDADGKGKIGIKGIVNLKEVTAKGQTCVYICSTSSSNINVCVYDDARVGIAGFTQTLTVNTYNNSCFYGRNLCACTAFVQAKDWTHVNVATSDKMSATATDDANVYYFGSPYMMTQFVSDNGLVIPIWNGTLRGVCALVARPVFHAPIYKGDIAVYESEMRRPRPRWVNRRMKGYG